MKYKIDDIVMINNVEWRISEYRMGRGREYKYTLLSEDADGTPITISLIERALKGIQSNGGFINGQYRMGERTIFSEYDL